MTENKDGIYPVLALRDMVLFPHVVIPLFIRKTPWKTINRFWL